MVRVKKMSKQHKRMVVFAIILIAAGIALNVSAYWLVPTSTQELDMYLTVSDYAGFNVNTSALFFGTTSPGGQASRNLILTNYGNASTRIEMRAVGEMENMTIVSANDIALAPSESRNVTVTVSVPSDMPYGNYTGKFIIQYFNR